MLGLGLGVEPLGDDALERRSTITIVPGNDLTRDCPWKPFSWHPTGSDLDGLECGIAMPYPWRDPEPLHKAEDKEHEQIHVHPLDRKRINAQRRIQKRQKQNAEKAARERKNEHRGRRDADRVSSRIE